MNFKWEKLGQLYAPRQADQHPKLLTHAANPLPILIEGDVYRIFFNARDADNCSSVGAVDVDIVSRTVIREHQNPFFENGPPGSYFAAGVSIGNCYEIDGNRYMLFMGWQTPINSHWRGDIGRLIVKPDLTLELDGNFPFLSADPVDPISISYPWVLGTSKNGFQMWYGSTITWDAGNGEMVHVLNYAKSTNGHVWSRHGLAVPYELGVAQAFSRPTVIVDSQNQYHMWYSYRTGNGETYRIGYARSSDGQLWQRHDASAGIDVSENGWDSEMIEYPFVLEHKEQRYMLYNGNGYGKTGFGLAVLIKT